MIRIIVLSIISFSCLCCGSNNVNSHKQQIFTGTEKGSILYPYVKSGQLSGTVEVNEVSNDTLLNLKYNTPLLDVRVDTVYFYCITDVVFKCLFKTPSGKGLMYLEQDRTGKYENYQDFGGWVKNVNIIEATDSGKETKLVFEVSSSGSFNFDYNGVCDFRSPNDNVSFTVECEE